MDHYIQNRYFNLNVMQYNVLAELYGVKDGQNAESMYKFKYRAPRIMQEIQNDDADIICLCEIDHYEDFYQQQLQYLGYQCYLAQQDQNGSYEVEGILIGWKTDKF